LAREEARILGAPSCCNGGPRENRLAALRTGSDVVLVDAGSLSGDGSIIGVASMVDAVVVVVEAGRTRKHEVIRTVETIEAAGGTIAGLVLNKRRTWIPSWAERILA
jgi:Mrp family chromosome partitioning ATPase